MQIEKLLLISKPLFNFLFIFYFIFKVLLDNIYWKHIHLYVQYYVTKFKITHIMILSKKTLSKYSPKAKYKGVDWVANILDDSRYGTWIWQWSFGSRSSNCTFVLTCTFVANLFTVATSSKQSRSTRLCFQEKRYIIPAVKLMAMRFFRYC